jgi:hypothetical protein
MRWALFGVLAFVNAQQSAVAAPNSGLSQLGGWVYVDRNNDGALTFSTDPNPEFAISEASVSLFSVLAGVESLVTTIQTDNFGRYLFENIAPGTYALRQIQPIEYVDGRDTLGILVGYGGQPIPGLASRGLRDENAFFDIVLTPDVGGEYYNFGERGLAPRYVSKRELFATPPPNSPPPPPPEGGIPEPSSLTLGLLGAAAILAIRRRRAIV